MYVRLFILLPIYPKFRKLQGKTYFLSAAEQVLGWSRALAGFGTSQQTKMNAWASLKGIFFSLYRVYSTSVYFDHSKT